MSHLASKDFIAVNCGVLTVSDTRDISNDLSGQYLADQLQKAGHNLVCRSIVTDDVKKIQVTVSNWLLLKELEVILVTGGTGFSVRDVTVESFQKIIKRAIPGFGEHFREVSRKSIGSSAMLSRSLAGYTNDYRLIFLLPGSSGACKDAWANIIKDQIDCRTSPCNLISNTIKFRRKFDFQPS